MDSAAVGTEFLHSRCALMSQLCGASCVEHAANQLLTGRCHASQNAVCRKRRTYGQWRLVLTRHWQKMHILLVGLSGCWLPQQNAHVGLQGCRGALHKAPWLPGLPLAPCHCRKEGGFGSKPAVAQQFEQDFPQCWCQWLCIADYLQAITQA